MVQDFPDRDLASQLFVWEKCDLALAWDWCRTLSSVQKTFHRRGRQLADSRQLGFSKKLVESKRFRQAMNIMLAANEAFETGFLSPAQLLSTVRTYASDGHFDDPAREYLRHEQAPGFGIKCHAGRCDQAISDHHRRPTR